MEEEILEAVRKSEPLPEDKYFKKIWETIESKAPVGERYYLRSFFTVFFFLLFMVIFILFYTDFLSSVLTLKEIRKENAKFFSTSASPLAPAAESGKSFEHFSIAKGITLTSLEKSRVLPEGEDENTVVLGFFSGHVLVEKSKASKTLVMRLPDMNITMTQGKCNIFCCDNIIRIIPLTHPLEIECQGKKQVIDPGVVFFLLNRERVVVLDKK